MFIIILYQTPSPTASFLPASSSCTHVYMPCLHPTTESHALSPLSMYEMADRLQLFETGGHMGTYVPLCAHDLTRPPNLTWVQQGRTAACQAPSRPSLTDSPLLDGTRPRMVCQPLVRGFILLERAVCWWFGIRWVWTARTFVRNGVCTMVRCSEILAVSSFGTNVHYIYIPH